MGNQKKSRCEKVLVIYVRDQILVKNRRKRVGYRARVYAIAMMSFWLLIVRLRFL